MEEPLEDPPEEPAVLGPLDAGADDGVADGEEVPEEPDEPEDEESEEPEESEEDDPPSFFAPAPAVAEARESLR